MAKSLLQDRGIQLFISAIVVTISLTVLYIATSGLPKVVSPAIQITNPYTDWDSYQDSVYGFSFQLPKNSYIEDERGICGARQGLFDDTELVSIAEKPAEQIVGTCGDFTFRVYLSHKHLNRLDQTKAILSKIKLSFDDITSEYVTLDGKEFLHISPKNTVLEVNGSVYQHYYLYYDENLEDVYTVYYDYEDEKFAPQLEKMAKSITFSAPSPPTTSILPPYYNRLSDSSFESTDFTKRQYNPKEKWFGNLKYPPILSSLKDADLVSMKCTPSIQEQTTETGRHYSYYKVLDGKTTETSLKDTGISDLFSFLRQKDLRITFRNVRYCVTDTHREFVFYNEYAPERFKDDNGFKIIELKDKKAITLIASEMDGYYFSCAGPFALANNDILYLSCGGGDMTSTASIQKIDMLNNKMLQVYSCSQNFDYDKYPQCKNN